MTKKFRFPHVTLTVMGLLLLGHGATADDAKPLRTSAAKEDSAGTYNEEREICGETRNTPNLHNIRYDSNDPSCHKVGDGKWCFKATQLAVLAPNSKWIFIGVPRLECVRDNQGSCGWNQLGKPDRYWLSLANPSEIRTTVLTNSRDIGLRICALARYYP